MIHFELVRSEVIVGGGNKSKITRRFDKFLKDRGWLEKVMGGGISAGGALYDAETHKVDFYKDRVAIEVEWNSKDSVYLRDLTAFRMLHEMGIISLGVIITRTDDLQVLFNNLGYDDEGSRIGKKYGASTTHWSKLMPHVNSGRGGACPLLLIRCEVYRDDIPNVPIRSTP